MRKRPEYDMRLIGKKLKLLRKAKGLTVEDVREYLCLGSVQAVYKYENGRGYPNVDTMFALMELYGADLYDVVGRSRTGLGWLGRMEQGQGVDYWYSAPCFQATWHCGGMQGHFAERLAEYVELSCGCKG